MPRRYAMDHRARGDGYDEPSGERAGGLRRTLYSSGRLPLVQTARADARAPRGRRQRAPAPEPEARRREPEPPGGFRDEVSFWPDRPDGFNRRGLVGLDAPVVFSGDSEAIYRPDPARYPNDTAPLAEAFELDLLAGVDLLDRSNGRLGVL